MVSQWSVISDVYVDGPFFVVSVRLPLSMPIAPKKARSPKEYHSH